MTSADDLAHHLATFFSEHLPVRIGASDGITILAYRDGLEALRLRFAAERTGRSVPGPPRHRPRRGYRARFSRFARDGSAQRHIVTRNHRRTALQAFFRYLGSVAPEYLAHCRRILAIPRKRAPQRTVDYLERAEIEALLAHIDRRTPLGRRDYALLAFVCTTPRSARCRNSWISP